MGLGLEGGLDEGGDGGAVVGAERPGGGGGADGDFGAADFGVDVVGGGEGEGVAARELLLKDEASLGEVAEREDGEQDEAGAAEDQRGEAPDERGFTVRHGGPPGW